MQDAVHRLRPDFDVAGTVTDGLEGAGRVGSVACWIIAQHANA